MIAADGCRAGCNNQYSQVHAFLEYRRQGSEDRRRHYASFVYVPPVRADESACDGPGQSAYADHAPRKYVRREPEAEPGTGAGEPAPVEGEVNDKHQRQVGRNPPGRQMRPETML